MLEIGPNLALVMTALIVSGAIVGLAVVGAQCYRLRLAAQATSHTSAAPSASCATATPAPGREVAMATFGADPGVEWFDTARPSEQCALIMDVVGSRYEVTGEMILSRSREQPVARARQVAMAVARDMTGLTLMEIARHFDRNHTTVMHAIQATDGMVTADIQQEVLEVCRERVGHVAGRPA